MVYQRRCYGNVDADARCVTCVATLKCTCVCVAVCRVCQIKLTLRCPSDPTGTSAVWRDTGFSCWFKVLAAPPVANRWAELRYPPDSCYSDINWLTTELKKYHVSVASFQY